MFEQAITQAAHTEAMVRDLTLQVAGHHLADADAATKRPSRLGMARRRMNLAWHERRGAGEKDFSRFWVPLPWPATKHRTVGS